MCVHFCRVLSAAWVRCWPRNQKAPPPAPICPVRVSHKVQPLLIMLLPDGRFMEDQSGALIRFPVLFGTKVSAFLRTLPPTPCRTIQTGNYKKRLAFCVAVHVCGGVRGLDVTLFSIISRFYSTVLLLPKKVSKWSLSLKMSLVLIPKADPSCVRIIRPVALKRVKSTVSSHKNTK